MGNNDCLQVDEIFRMKFRGRLIMMSACKAEMTNYSTGLEIAAFNRALIYAGSPSVISTLWKVDEKAKGIFMDIFYTNLDKSENIAALLKVTKNFMIKSGYPPSEWAAFVLNGNN
jgi:CHAT domain-containing protein